MCVCVGEAMGEADGQGGGLATFKEKKKKFFTFFFKLFFVGRGLEVVHM